MTSSFTPFRDTALAALLCALFAANANAQTTPPPKGALTGVTLVPNQLPESETLSGVPPNIELKMEGVGLCHVRIRGFTEDNGYLGEQPLAVALPKSAYWSSKSLKAGKYKFVTEINPAVGGALDKCSGKIESVFTVTKPTPVLANVNLAGVSPCPAGWNLVPGSATAGGAYACKPAKPQPKQPCPTKHEWFDDGCTAGCKQVIY